MTTEALQERCIWTLLFLCHAVQQQKVLSSPWVGALKGNLPKFFFFVCFQTIFALFVFLGCLFYLTRHRCWCSRCGKRPRRGHRSATRRCLLAWSRQRDHDRKDLFIRRETSTRKGFHSTFAAFVWRSLCWGEGPFACYSHDESTTVRG